MTDTEIVTAIKAEMRKHECTDNNCMFRLTNGWGTNGGCESDGERGLVARHFVRWLSKLLREVPR